MNCNNSSTRRLALLSAGVSLFGAVAAFGAGPGGSITISSSPALQLGASGLTQGLVGTVWHTGSGTYAMPPGANGKGTYGNLPDVSDVETFINSGSYNSPTTGGIYTLPAPAETFLNTADVNGTCVIGLCEGKRICARGCNFDVAHLIYNRIIPRIAII